MVVVVGVFVQINNEHFFDVPFGHVIDVRAGGELENDYRHN